MKKLAIGLAVLAAGYVALLAILGFALQGCVSDMAAERLAESLDADVVVGDASVSVLRGKISLSDVEVTREEGGHLDLRIEHIAADIAPMGWSVIDRDPRGVTVRGVDLSISARGAMAIPKRPKRKPLRIGGMRIERVRLVAMPTALLPQMGRVELTVEEVDTGPVVLESSIDWIFALREFEAQAKVSESVDVGIEYGDGRLGVRGGVFGSDMVTVPFTMPVPQSGDLEPEKLQLLLLEAGKALASEAGKRWLQGKVTDRMNDLLQP